MNHLNNNRLADPETLMQCPYDNTHMVRIMRWQPHIIKCRRNHPTRELKCCPFNARHELPAVEMPYHLTICPDQVVVHAEILSGMNNQGGRVVKGNTTAPPVDHEMPAVSEDWDEASRRSNVNVLGTRDPGTTRLTAPQRRQHRTLLKELMEAEKEGRPTHEIKEQIRALTMSNTPPRAAVQPAEVTGEPPPLPEMRKPRTAPIAGSMPLMNGVHKANVNASSGATKSRLAANFNNTTPVPPGFGRGMARVYSTPSNVDERVEILQKLAAGRGAGKPRV